MGVHRHVSGFRILELILISAATLVLVGTVAVGRTPRVPQAFDNTDIYQKLLELDADLASISMKLGTMTLPSPGSASGLADTATQDMLQEIYDEVTGTYGSSVYDIGWKLDSMCEELGLTCQLVYRTWDGEPLPPFPDPSD